MTRASRRSGCPAWWWLSCGTAWQSCRQVNVAALQRGLDQLLEQLVQDRIAPLDGLAACRAADLAADRKARGRQVDLRDTLIAGIALARGAQLATRNTRHFIDTSISLINPFAP